MFMEYSDAYDHLDRREFKTSFYKYLFESLIPITLNLNIADWMTSHIMYSQ